MTCDPGVDDAIALAVLAGHPDGTIDAIVAGAGNVPADVAWRNAAGIAALVGLDVPVGIGSDRALDGTPIRRDGGVHGTDGLAGLGHRLPAPEAPKGDGLPLVRGNVLAIGPLTDVALAIRAGQRLDRVVWMGGSTLTEFNAAADPLAVAEVLDATTDLAVVPIETTRQMTLDDDALARWSSGSRLSRLCAELAATRRTPSGASPITVHDPVVVIAALEPELFACSPQPLAPGARPARAAVGVDVATVCARIVGAVEAAAST